MENKSLEAIFQTGSTVRTFGVFPFVVLWGQPIGDLGLGQVQYIMGCLCRMSDTGGRGDG